jgi:hypothetical protein
VHLAVLDYVPIYSPYTANSVYNTSKYCLKTVVVNRKTIKKRTAGSLLPEEIHFIVALQNIFN